MCGLVLALGLDWMGQNNFSLPTVQLGLVYNQNGLVQIGTVLYRS
jgi:hypothetical protein